MFKSNKHKSDRLRERVEFRFSSFQAFQIPKGWDRLLLSLVSVDTGKTVAKASKATVRSGTCQWTETFSEFIWTLQGNASEDIEECMYKIVISMGSHRLGILGELVINLADYTSIPDTGSFSLPLQKCHYGTILQVRIQCLVPKGGFRDRRSLKEAPSYHEDLHTSNDDVGSKSNAYDSMLNRNLGYSSGSHLGVTYAEETVSQGTGFSASGSHLSSDSEDNHNINGRSYVGQQISAGSSRVRPTEDVSRSSPASFNSRASGSNTPMSLRPIGCPKDFLEVAEETIDELQDEAKVRERRARKLKLEVEKYKKESAEKSRREVELDTELKAAYSELDSLKQEIEQLKSSLEEATTKQTMTRAAKELEGEVKLVKESNANLSLQLKKSQETNMELVSILEELEETVEKQRFEIDNFAQRSPDDEDEGGIWNEKLLAVEAEWTVKLSNKDKEIIKLEEKLSAMQENKLGCGHSDLIKEFEELRGKVQELERDCSELTEENLELILKTKESCKDVREENESENSDSEVDFLKSQIHRLEEELRSNEMNVEKICTDLDVELQFFKDQTNHLAIKLRESQLEVEEKSAEIKEMQENLEGKQNAGNEPEIQELKIAFSVKEKEIDILSHEKEEMEVLITNIQQEKAQLEEKLASVLRESSMTTKRLEDIQREMALRLSTSTNKTLQRKIIELECSKNELEIQLVELEEENIKLTERLSDLEDQLGYMTDDKESSRLELDDSNTVVLDLKDEVTKLEVKLTELQKNASEFLEKAEFLELKLSSMQDEIASKEKMLTSRLENISQDQDEQEEKINQAKLMLNQIDVENRVGVENLKREIAHLYSQFYVTDDERQKMMSDTVLDFSSLHSDKIKIETNLREAYAKVKPHETETESLKEESGKKVEGLFDVLNAPKQSEETLMSGIEILQRQAEAAKSSEEKFKEAGSEPELKPRISDNERQKTIEESTSLNVQVQKIAHLQDEILVLKSSLEEVKIETGKLEEALRSISEECEGLKSERMSFVEKISNMQKVLHDSEEKSQTRDVVQLADADQTKRKNHSKDLEATIRELQSKIRSLENELVESVETNNMYKIQLQGLVAEKQGCSNEIPKASVSENDTGSQRTSNIASLEAELKEIKERYLHMSLQYAEVEAERQELILKLKTTTKGKGWFS